MREVKTAKVAVVKGTGEHGLVVNVELGSCWEGSKTQEVDRQTR